MNSARMGCCFETGQKRAGFSLMEVIVALGIFAIMAVGLLQAVNNVQEALISTQELSGREEAKRFVMRRVLSATSNSTVTAGGAVALSDGGTVSWSVSLYSTAMPDLHQVDLVLDWDDGESEMVTLWAYRPAWSDATERSSLLQSMREQYPQSRLSTY